jgi:hypothetical protein
VLAKAAPRTRAARDFSSSVRSSSLRGVTLRPKEQNRQPGPGNRAGECRWGLARGVQPGAPGWEKNCSAYGAPGGCAEIRNIRIIGHADEQPLFQFVETVEQRDRRVGREWNARFGGLRGFLQTGEPILDRRMAAVRRGSAFGNFPCWGSGSGDRRFAQIACEAIGQGRTLAAFVPSLLVHHLWKTKNAPKTRQAKPAA